MNILVTGSNGFVGSYVVKHLLNKGFNVFGSSRSADRSSFNTNPRYRFAQVDLGNPFAVHDMFAFVQPDVVVHCAAMSKPDECELKQADAYTANMESTVHLLLNAEEYKSHFIQLSTDFVFNGKEGMYKEDDLPDPVSYYGKTKLQSEEAVEEYPHDWAIVRTVFVYGKPLYGRNDFITMIAGKIKKGEPYQVVSDQERTPTYAPDLAGGIVAIIEQKAKGIYNICGADIRTPYQMAMDTAAVLGVAANAIQPILTADLNESAKRPLKSGLDITKARTILGYNPVSFEEGLRLTLE